MLFLPENYEGGDVVLYGQDIKRLPTNFHITGSVCFIEQDKEYPILEIPDGLQVSGDFICHSCENLKSLPNNLIVSGNICLHGCYSLTSLPNDLKINGNIDFNSVNLWLNCLTRHVREWLDENGISPVLKIAKAFSNCLLVY